MKGWFRVPLSIGLGCARVSVTCFGGYDWFVPVGGAAVAGIFGGNVRNRRAIAAADCAEYRRGFRRCVRPNTVLEYRYDADLDSARL